MTHSPEDPMERYDLLYRLYDEFDTRTVRSYAEFVELFPPVDSRVALEGWNDANTQLRDRKTAIRRRFADAGDTFAELAATATREQAFTALDLLAKYGRTPNVLVLDVDETLRSAGTTDNEIPRETLHLLTQFHEAGIPIVICTGQTLENVKGFLIQGLGNEIVFSGDVSIVYEAGTGVFTPGRGADTKQLLYSNLDERIKTIFSNARSRVLADAPADLRRDYHLQGNEFNLTIKPNFETGSNQARETIDRALVYLIDVLEESVEAVLGATPSVSGFARAYYADKDPEIREVLTRRDARPPAEVTPESVPEQFREFFELIDVAYYEADAAEIGSLELNKVYGIESALDVLGIEDPFALVMGDSKSDLRMMRWAQDNDTGIAAAPEHASEDVLDHVRETDDLVFDQGDAAEMLRTALALTKLADLST
ncbi:MAG: HAD-superfamily hydrolase, subfamily IIB [uncultured archaeon A07HR60]|nr:MAG: HAD-superfamily hydrolase, subfamily IIB [uncultured archaeon A07HR60]